MLDAVPPTDWHIVSTVRADSQHWLSRRPVATDLLRTVYPKDRPRSAARSRVHKRTGLPAQRSTGADRVAAYREVQVSRGHRIPSQPEPRG